MKVYLCGPINGCTDEECKDWRQAFKAGVLPGDECIDPMKRDYRGKEAESYREIVELDKRDLRRADVLIANCPKPSVGTSMEIYDAWLRGIPVVTWIPTDAVISPWLRYHSTVIVHSLPEAIAKVQEIA
jgi:nucleoside 2-deoxyribosyltransferase